MGNTGDGDRGDVGTARMGDTGNEGMGVCLFCFLYHFVSISTHIVVDPLQEKKLAPSLSLYQLSIPYCNISPNFEFKPF